MCTISSTSHCVGSLSKTSSAALCAMIENKSSIQVYTVLFSLHWAYYLNTSNSYLVYEVSRCQNPQLLFLSLRYKECYHISNAPLWLHVYVFKNRIVIYRLHNIYVYIFLWVLIIFSIVHLRLHICTVSDLHSYQTEWNFLNSINLFILGNKYLKKTALSNT